MIYCCSLCAPDKIREGRIPEGGGIPQCAEHRAEIYWRSRQPNPSRVVTWPPSPEEAYQTAMALALLDHAAIAG
jgi:hypothetical protein